MVARVLHARSARRQAGFVRVDSEFYETGRFQEKLRRAAGGTLLIKEVAQVGRDPQRILAPLLRPARDVPDVRLLASTGVDLGLAVEAGRFDAELYRRLGGLRIPIPPLRARPEDVPLFAEHFLRESVEELGRDEPLSFSSRAVDKLKAYSWPGNVAELRDVVRRLSIRARQEVIDLGDVELVLPPVHERVPLEQMSFEDMVRSKLRTLLQRMEGYPIKDLYDEVIGRVERPLIEEVLARTGNNQVKAAEMLGMNRNTLRKKIAEREVQTAIERGRKRS